MSDSARIAFWLYIIALLLIFGMPQAKGHTVEELDTFVEEWRDAMPWTIEEVEVWQDMAERHPWYFSHAPVRVVRPTQTASRPNRGMGTNVEQWRGLVASFFPAEQVERALCIIAHESGGNPDAKNPNSSASGLFQHLARYWPERSSAAGWGGASIWDPTANTAVAAWLWSRDGWWHWAPYVRGECR